jgi:uncharacterized protein (DUF2336 family)
MGHSDPIKHPLRSGVYEENKAQARSAEISQRKELALRTEVEPEILYYLAEDEAADVRRVVAANIGTPVQANSLLAEDEDQEVRLELARKITKLIPTLQGQEVEQLLEQTITILEILAADHLPTVRAIVSEAIKEETSVPKSLVKTLAQDAEEIVASPVLEYSPLLSDADLLEIIAGGVAAGALPAIARRQDIGEDVSQSVAASLEIPAVAALLANPSANIRESTLEEIIDQAEDVQNLHEPLVMRLDLSLRAVRRIAGFVASSLVDSLAKKHKLSPSLEKEVKLAAKGRIEETREFTDLPGIDTADEAEKLWLEGHLTEETIVEAVKDRKSAFVTKALSLLSGYQLKTTESMLGSRNGKVVFSLCWKADLSMRLAFDIQTKIAKVSRKGIVNARNGIEFPFTDEEMDWQLSFYSES